MATRFETLIAAISDKLKADVDTLAGSVYTQRVGAFADNELPAYNITYGADEPMTDLGASNVAFIDWQFLVFIDCYERENTGAVDTLFQNMRRNIHRALMADVTQGLSWVHTTIPQGADEPVLDDTGDKRAFVYRVNWIFRIRTSIGDLES